MNATATDVVGQDAAYERVEDAEGDVATADNAVVSEVEMAGVDLLAVELAVDTRHLMITFETATAVPENLPDGHSLSYVVEIWDQDAPVYEVHIVQHGSRMIVLWADLASFSFSELPLSPDRVETNAGTALSVTILLQELEQPNNASTLLDADLTWVASSRREVERGGGWVAWDTIPDYETMVGPPSPEIRLPFPIYHEAD